MSVKLLNRPTVNRRTAPVPLGVWRGQGGEGRLALLVWLAIVGLAVAAGWEAIPAKLKVDRFQDFLVQTSERASSKAQTARFQQVILDKAKELDLPVAKEQIKVTVTSRRVQLRVEYTLPLSLPFYTYQWQKVHDVDRPVFLW